MKKVRRYGCLFVETATVLPVLMHRTPAKIELAVDTLGG